MNENTSNSKAGEVSTSKPPKQGQYRPSAAKPAERVNANDMLQLLHGGMKKAIERTEKAAERTEKAAAMNERTAAKVGKAINDAVEQSSKKTAQTLGQQWLQFQKSLDSFKSTLKRWLWWIVVAILWAVIASGLAVWQCSSAIDARKEVKAMQRVQRERDSLQRQNDILWGFAEDNPQTFKKWREKKGL